MRLARLIGILLVALVAAASAAAASGPVAGGVDIATYGLRDGSLRYFTVLSGRRTVVQAVTVRGGHIVRFNSIPGQWGIPLIANDGTTGGLSHDRSTLVLQSVQSHPTKFAVLDVQSLRVRQTITLKGFWSFDALSPAAQTLYLIQHVQQRNANANRYHVRAYDLFRDRLVKKIIFDTREKWSLMSGQPVTRVTSRSGRWVYTLYSRPGGSPFVHALDSSYRRAVCIDLPWRGSQRRIFGAKLRLEPGRLVVHRGSPLAVIDTHTFRVSA